MMNMFKFVLFVIILPMVLTSCVSTQQNSSSTAYQHTPLQADISGLKKEHDDESVKIYIRPNAPTLQSYTHFIIDDVKTSPNDRSITALDQKKLNEMKVFFKETLTKELTEAGYRVGGNVTDKTLKISVVLSNIKIPKREANTLTLLIPVALSVGEVTLEAQFIQASSNRLDAVALTHAKGERFLNTSLWSEWADIKSSLSKLAKGIRQGIDNAHKSS